MVNKNNKGFSLTEVVVSVAVLLLLLSPILTQMMQSIRTQSLAKERLYALENANSVLEVVKSADKDKIASRSGDLFSVQNIGGTQEMAKGTETCTLFIQSGGSISRLGGGTTGLVEYNYTDYILSDAAFGKGQYKYSRVVTIDDLANKVKSLEVGGKHYNIVYGLTADDVSAATIGGFNFVRTNEGSYVSYTADNHGTSSKTDVNHVRAILVQEATTTTSTYSDPNAIDLGHIQDLDETKVAIVEGAASNFDVQAEEDFYNLKLQHLKEANPTQWHNLMVSEVDENVFQTANYAETVNKLTTIVFEKDFDSVKGMDKYIVTVNVTYEDHYSLPVVEAGSGASRTYVDSVTYRVYSREFYTNRCPDVYYMYEPYVYSTANGKVQYRSIDNISVDNEITWERDAGTGDITDTIPNIYIIRPDNTKFDKVLTNYQSDTRFRSQVIDKISSAVSTGEDADYWKDVYYTDITHSWLPVTLHIFQTDHCTNNVDEIIPIYTDLPFEFDASRASTFMKQYIDTTYATGTFNEILEHRSIGHYYEDKVLDISTASREGDGRLFTATVTYRKLDKSGANVVAGYDIRFQSGKGAD